MSLKFGLPALVLSTIFVILYVTIVENNLSKVAPKSQLVHAALPLSNTSNLLDLRNFKYVINTDCNTTFLVWVVTSYAGDPADRSALRRAYTEKELQALKIRRVFLLGTLNDQSTETTKVSQSAILDEAHRFRDIIQGNFIEAYHNLTYKHLMGLQWAVTTCSHARYVMKMDDDIILNLYSILDKIHFIAPSDALMGYIFKNMVPIREPNNKWYVTKEDFSSDVYPEFLSGWLYVAGLRTVSLLVERSRQHSKYFWIDDVFVTGILRQELNIDMKDIHESYAMDYRYLNCCIKGKKKKLKCEFDVGPNGGDTALQVKFKEFTEFCRFTCSVRPAQLSVKNTCIVAYLKAKPGKGRAQVQPFKVV
ncbi:beta-1,3-galactosyltransferase 5 [Orussus abietinus]|uniref:beta-1,3-galactosyltransferase 5 n=1 Tax=Orussus abietinus TaxID=222816 RepID=UPI0006256C40|nr:beta-1,3-galactosyltransferase 5 [Orussus abietinus]